MSIKKIVLDNGHVLEVEHDDNFLNIVREKMEIDSQSEVEDSHIKAFIYGAFNNAMESYESGKYETVENNLPVDFDKG